MALVHSVDSDVANKKCITLIIQINISLLRIYLNLITIKYYDDFLNHYKSRSAYYFEAQQKIYHSRKT